MAEKKKKHRPEVFWMRKLADRLGGIVRPVAIGVDSDAAADLLARNRELELEHNKPSKRVMARAAGKAARPNRGHKRKPKEARI